jgi:hypothetical protein
MMEGSDNASGGTDRYTKSVELTDFECDMYKFLRALSIRVSAINLGVSSLSICVLELNYNV